MPNSIARVNARFAGGIASSSASPMPRGQRSHGVAAEQLHETVRERDAGATVAARRGGSARASPYSPSASRGVSMTTARELECIAQAEVEALARDRMQRLRRVADDRDARRRRSARELERQRKRAALADARKPADAAAEVLRERGEECGVGAARACARASAGVMRPHEPVVVAFGQQRHRAVRREALVGDAAVRRARVDIAATSATCP